MFSFGSFIPHEECWDEDERFFSTSLELDESLQIGQGVGDLLDFFTAGSSEEDNCGEIRCDGCFEACLVVGEAASAAQSCADAAQAAAQEVGFYTVCDNVMFLFEFL